ncbi:protein kinase/lanthionine synthetase C family protein [Longitalea luteola]|uniref:protein kinase/lanthionine synthetase C family protein n=1 Tax=Longitalea luteola TaxID=2812563 RepID=UPI001A95CB8E|nr:protein kinase/lanthionine synthetase C family protein [Longitalea luteola]
MKAASEITVSQSAVETEVKGKAIKKAGKRIGYNYIIVKSLKESQKNDVVKCLYIKSLTNFGFCVIKEGTYGDSKDKHGRDIKDRLIWQQQLHAALQDKVRMPRLLGHFEENGNYYLVMERIKGKPLYKACRDKNGELRDGLLTGTRTGITFVNYLIQIVDLLNTLHKHHVVHRDATSNNFIIMPNGKVAVIDMELSYSLQQQAPAPPFQLGTHGYMSPEQLKTETPTIKEDVFSAGAVLLQVWTGISPYKLTDTQIDELYDKVHFLIPDKIIADMVVQCLHPDATKRPALPLVYDALVQYKGDLRNKVERQVIKPVAYTSTQIQQVVKRALNTLTSPLLADENKGWFSEDMEAEPNIDKNKINKAWYTSFSKGATGAMYVINVANRLGFDISTASTPIHHALNLIESKYMKRIGQVSASLHFGSSGIAATLACAIADGLIEPKTIYLDWINELLNRENQEPGFINGIAGQGMAHWLCHDFLPPGTMRERLSKYVGWLIQHQHKDGSWVYKEVKGKQKKRQGFANGASGIIYFLLEYAKRYNDKKAQAAAQAGLRWLMKKAVHRGDKIQWRTDRNKELMHWWSEGTSGIALAFIKAYECSDSPTDKLQYKHYATGALLNHPKQVLDNNLSQLQGLSGLGEVYLEAYKVFQEAEWQERAGWIAQVIMHLKKDHPQFGPYWLVQHERQPTSEFMTGNSGVIHFLLRYCYPDGIRMPLL